MGRLHSTGVLVSALAFSATLLGAQTLAPAPPARFEVVSIRPSAPGANANGSYHMLGAVDPGEWRATGVYLQALIDYAYGLKLYDDRVEELPRWTQTAEYDISAQIPLHARQAQIQLMVRAMLADRFKLALHQETHQRPAATLAVAPGGPKLKPDRACNSSDLPLVLIPLRPPRVASARDLDCGEWARSPASSGSNITVKFHGMTMAALAQFTASQTEPVIDRTGLKGAYDFILTYRTISGRGVSRDHWPDVDAQNLRYREDAYLKQLGLKLNLRPTKQPVPVLVVDHVEKPTPN